MYKNILEGDGNGNGNGNGHGQKRFDSHEISNLSNSHESHAPHASHSGGGGGGGSFMTSKREKDKDKKTKTMQKILRDDSPELDQEKEHERIRENDNAYEMKNDAVASVASHCSSNEIKNIDDVFIRITDIYTQDIYNIIYNTLNLMSKNDAECNIYIDGLNKILEPTNNRIKKWIDENIVF